MRRGTFLGAAFVGGFIVLGGWAASPGDDNRPPRAAPAVLADAIANLNPAVLRGADDELASMVRREQRRRLQTANDRSRTAWQTIQGREDWEAFCKPRLEALRRSLGSFPAPPSPLNVRVTGTIPGDGFRVENILFESRPGVWVTANLYLPARPVEKPPGILLCHSHHTPKEHGELQDMGMTWARAGCAVLVMDHWGHGERRQHPFRTADDYAGDFRLGRQDYYFRYDTAIRLQLAGESLIGWMAWDLMRGVDLLLSRPGADPQRIILLGAVAGGGDPAAVTAALDSRIAAVAPFNFGGPQPETRYPLPDDAETSFNYAGSGSWESTRNLRNSAADGFLPWVIVGGVAPRRLVYAHEFRWDRPRDPVWRRLQRVYGFYERPDLLAFTHGRGELRGQTPDATHCTHVGRAHRVMIHAALQQWFGIAVTAEDEYTARLAPEQLHALTPAAEQELQPRTLSDVLAELAATRLAVARQAREAVSPAMQRESLRRAWRGLLKVTPREKPPQAMVVDERQSLPSGVTVERLALETDSGITVPLLLFLPAAREGKPSPVVVAVAQEGKAGFLHHRSKEIAQLLAGGAAVALPDVRGVGETRTGADRGRTGADAALASTEQMLGGTMIGARLRDLQAALNYLRQRCDLDRRRVALWGDSFAPTNPPDADLRVPHGVGGRPLQSEPLGGMLALLGALDDDEIAAASIQGGLASLEPVVTNPIVMVPHDVVSPGALTVGDLDDVAAAVAPRPLWLHGLVDHLNRRLSQEEMKTAYGRAARAYAQAGRTEQFHLAEETDDLAAWLLAQLSE